jgi:hypothetical protein
LNKNKIFYSVIVLFILITTFFIGSRVLSNHFNASKKSEGSFHISQFINSNWKEIYDQSFGVEYQTKTFVITPRDGKVQIQINQKNIPYSDIEFVHLNACGVNVNP